MRQFKLAVSLDLHPDAAPRFSINDTGEPSEFRRRVFRAHQALGLNRQWLNDFWSLSAAGDGQTTLSVKWEATGLRVGLYFEELTEHSDAHGCREKVCDFISTPCPPVREGALGAICVDLVGGAPMGYKEYYMVDLNQPMALAAGLWDYADRLSLHPSTGKKRALYAIPIWFR